MTNSIGIIETKSVAFACESLNRILKDKEIELLNIEFPGEGLITVFLFAEYSKMKNSMETAGNLSASFAAYFRSSIITKPDEKLFTILKTGKKAAAETKQKSVEKTEVKNQNNVMLDITPAELMTDEKDEVKEEPKEEKKTEIIKPERIIRLKQKPVKEKTAQPVKSEVKTFKSRVDNPTIARLKKEALGKKNIGQKKNDLHEDNNEFDQQNEMTLDKLEQINVHKLRHYARSFNGFPIKGREISRANREELLNHFKQLI